MTPIETVKGRVGPKELERFAGRKVFGVFYVEADREVRSREDLQRRLVEILASEGGWVKSEKRLTEWERRRQKNIREHGEDAIISFFPSFVAHRQWTKFCLSLERAGIYTIPELVSRGDVDGIKGIGDSGDEAVKMIIDWYLQQNVSPSSSLS